MSSSLIDVGTLTKPATVLIEKISAAVGAIFEPYQIRRIAEAEGHAAMVRAETEIKVTDLHRRAVHRFMEEEAQRQSNIEAITQAALPLLLENSDPSKVENDWITNFFDKSRIVSDREMQILWAHLLAAEANSPGKFSRQTVNLLSDIGTADAKVFERFLSFSLDFSDGRKHLFIFWSDVREMYDISFDYEDAVLLESLGLIHFEDDGYHVQIDGESATYGKVKITFPESRDELAAGTISLTRSGEQLAGLCNLEFSEAFLQDLKNRWPSAKFE